MAKRIIDHIPIEKIVMGVGSQSEPTPCKTLFKNAERSTIFEGEKRSVFLLLIIKNINGGLKKVVLSRWGKALRCV